MKAVSALIGIAGLVILGAMATRAARSSQDKYSVSVPNGPAFSDFKGYEGWEVISLSHGKLRTA